MIQSRKTVVVLIVPAVLLILISCGEKSEQEVILELMNKAGDLIEKENLPGLMDLLAEDYSDFEGRTKPATERLVKDYFQNRRGIVVHFLGVEIGEITEGGEAHLEMDVLLSSGGAEAFRKLIRAVGDFFRFKIDLRKTGESWKIQYAEWQDIGRDSLLPQSLPVLKKLFGL